MQIDVQLPTTLSEEDLETVLTVYEMTSTESRPGIIIFKGPETDDLFPDQDYTHIPRLGTTTTRNKTSSGIGRGREPRFFRYIERLFEGSDVFPNGLPVGGHMRYVPSDLLSGEFGRDRSLRDISDQEFRRLYSLAHGFEHWTDEERRAHEKRMEKMRRGQSHPEQSQFASEFAKMLAGGFAQMQENQQKEYAETAKTKARRGRKPVATEASE